MNNKQLQLIPKVGVYLVCIFIFFACGNGAWFDKNQTIAEEKWNREDIIKFDVKVDDTVTSTDFYLNIRNTTDYRFSNLYLFIKTVFPDKKFARDTVECILSSPDGKWLGKGLSRLKESHILLKKGIRFPKKGIYSFEIEQGMRVETLEGIADVGIRIQKH